MNSPFNYIKYNLKKAIYWTILRVQFLLSEDFLLIFQMGKVGSSSLEYSLKNYVRKPVYKIHFLSDEGIAMCEDSHQRRLKRGMYEVDYALIQMKSLRSQLEKRKKGQSRKNWKVICIVREPIIRTISAYFQNAYRWIPDFENLLLKPEEVLNELIEDFNARKHLHGQVKTWFEIEVKEVFDINVFEQAFDKEKGCSVYSNDWCKLLVLKLEKLTENLEMVKQFTGISEFELVNYNEAENKYYAELYKEFKQKIELSDEFVSGMYSSPFMTTFYTTEEVEKFLGTWNIISSNTSNQSSTTLVP